MSILQQRAVTMISELPDESVRILIDFISLIMPKKHEASDAERKQAYEDMLSMREASNYPKDFDYKKVYAEELVKNQFVALFSNGENDN